MTKKKYGLTDEEKRRMAEYRREEYEKLPWSLPMCAWEGYELNTLRNHGSRVNFEYLDAREKEIKEKNEKKEQE